MRGWRTMTGRARFGRDASHPNPSRPVTCKRQGNSQARHEEPPSSLSERSCVEGHLSEYYTRWVPGGEDGSSSVRCVAESNPVR